VQKVASVAAGGLHMVAFGEPIPVVTAVSPTTGPTAGGTTVTITGASLAGATGVKFGTVAATGVIVNSASSVTATAPAGTGLVDITVTTPNGTSPPTSSDRFTYIPPPAITKLAPKTGPAVGGETVTISGEHFVGPVTVHFGSVEATNVKVISGTSITAVSPAQTAASVEVTVSTEYGTSAPSPSDHFKVLPSVTAVSPNKGTVAGGTSVTVTGTGFALGTTETQVKFGPLYSSSVNCTTSTECTATAPAHGAAVLDVSAVVNKVASLKNPPGDQFTYE